MSSPLTNLIGGKAQAVGENLNTWGVSPNLNDTLQVLANVGVRWNALTINSGATTTISETNYSTSNDTETATLKLTAGTIAAAFALVLPGRAKRLLVWNATGYTATIKLAATTGFALPTDRWTWVTTDGTTDVYNHGSIYVGTGYTVTNSGDVANKSYVDTAIATASIPASAGTVLNSGADTTAKYAGAWLTVQISGTSTTQIAGLQTVQLATVHAGGNEQTLVTISTAYIGAFLNGGSKSSQFTPVVGSQYTCDFTASSWTVNLSGMTTPQIGQRIKLNCFGNYQPFLLGTVNGLANVYIAAGTNGELEYSSASWGWN